MRLHILPENRAADVERDLEDRVELDGRYDLVRKPGTDERWDVVQPKDHLGEFTAVEGRDALHGPVILLKGGTVGMLLVKPAQAD